MKGCKKSNVKYPNTHYIPFHIKHNGKVQKNWVLILNKMLNWRYCSGILSLNEPWDPNGYQSHISLQKCREKFSQSMFCLGAWYSRSSSIKNNK